MPQQHTARHTLRPRAVLSAATGRGRCGRTKNQQVGNVDRQAGGVVCGICSEFSCAWVARHPHLIALHTHLSRAYTPTAECELKAQCLLSQYSEH